MELAISTEHDTQVQEMQDAVASVKETTDALVRRIDPSGEIQRKVNKMIMLSGGGVRGLAKVHEEIWRELNEAAERCRKTIESMRAQMQRSMKSIVPRVQGRSSGTGKPAAKKQASTSTNSGGDSGGGGDGDGPAPRRNRSKQKRRSSNRSNHSQHPPSVPPGAIANTSSPQSPPPKPPQGSGLIIWLVAILLIFVAYLLDKGERDMAWSILGPLSTAVILYIKPPSKER